MSGQTRVAAVIAVIASLALLVAVVAGYTERAVGNPEQFADRATDALRNDRVQVLATEQITDQLIRRSTTDLTAARPIVAAAVSRAVSGPAFEKAFRSAVLDVHRSVVDRSDRTVTLTVTGVGPIVAEAMQRVRPSLAEQIPSIDRIELVRQRLDTVSARATQIADTTRVIALLALIVYVALVVVALVSTADRRRTAVELAIGAGVAGLLLVAALFVARPIAVEAAGDADAQAVARAVWDAFFGGLLTVGWILAAGGVAIALLLRVACGHRRAAVPIGRAG